MGYFTSQRGFLDGLEIHTHLPATPIEMDSVDTVLIAKEKPEKSKTYKNQEIQVDTLDNIDIPEDIVVEKKEKTSEKKKTEKIKEETKESAIAEAEEG